MKNINIVVIVLWEYSQKERKKEIDLRVISLYTNEHSVGV